MGKTTKKDIQTFPVEKIDSKRIRLKQKVTVEEDIDEVLTIDDLKDQVVNIEKAMADTNAAKTKAITRFDQDIARLTSQRDQILQSIAEAKALGVEEEARGQ